MILLLNFLKKIKFRFLTSYKNLKWTIIFNSLYFRTLYRKECYYGPFTGEFGHLLGHNLSFIAYLYSKNIKVHYCGMAIHKPFFYDEKGQCLVNDYLELRDFFIESVPDCNQAEVPLDVQGDCTAFISKAKKSGLPYWDNSNKEYYFNFFRWMILKNNYMKVYDLSKLYKSNFENSVVIFPRKWNNNFPKPEQIQNQLKNNGEIWEYYLIAQIAAKYFEKVYVIGHPVFSSVNFNSFENVEVILTNDNSVILEKCIKSKLIISQHSGSVYIGEYTDTPILIIYKGGRTIGDIEITKKFKNGLGKKYDFNFAYSLEEIEDFLNKLKYETIRN